MIIKQTYFSRFLASPMITVRHFSPNLKISSIHFFLETGHLNLETYFSRFYNSHKSTGRHISPIKLNAIIDNVHIHFVLIAGHLNIQTYFSHFHNSHELTRRHISLTQANATRSYVQQFYIHPNISYLILIQSLFK